MGRSVWASINVRNVAIPDGPAVASRTVWTTGEDGPLTTTGLSEIHATIASDHALAVLGMPDHVGTVHTAADMTVPVMTRFEMPDYLAFMDPIVLAASTEPGPIAIIVIVVEHVNDVAAVTPIIRNALMATDPGKVSIETTGDFARVQAVVAGQLGGYGSALVIATLLALAGIVTSLLWGLVMIRRKDFGRRRALGASQPFIIALVLTQTGIAAVVGALIGTLGGTVTLTLLGDPQPSPQFTLAVAVLAISASLLGAIPPAVIASRREPLAELRVP